jgi:hypothetical protein
MFWSSSGVKATDIVVVHQLMFQRLNRQHQWQAATGVCDQKEAGKTVNR